LGARYVTFGIQTFRPWKHVSSTPRFSGAFCSYDSGLFARLLADEGGVSVWLPGFFGSLAASPLQPGWSLTSIYYHTSVSAGADVSKAREITIGRIPPNLNVNLSANLDARADLALALPTYTFATPVFGAQATVGVLGYMAATAHRWERRFQAH
jgi:hypothetical protein